MGQRKIRKEHGEMNDELGHGLKQEDIIKFIKSQILRWAAHVMRMENKRTTRKITEWTPFKTRTVGRSRLNFWRRNYFFNFSTPCI